MHWPTLIVDNFFTDPHAIVKLAKTFKYTQDILNEWPGTRTSPVPEVDKEFFRWSTKKIMALLYPMNLDGMSWDALQYFQRVPYKIYGKEGWVHNDDKFEFTSIIYLSDYSDSGTCLYEGKHFNTVAKYEEEKKKFYRDLKDLKRMEKYREEANSTFTKKVELCSNFNRLVLFDGANWHSSKGDGAYKDDRLTLITFFKNITAKDIRYPITEMRRF